MDISLYTPPFFSSAVFGTETCWKITGPEVEKPRLYFRLGYLPRTVKLWEHSIALRFSFLILKKPHWIVMPQASPQMGRGWPELSQTKSHHLVLLPQVDTDISINQNNNLNKKKEIVFRVKTLFNFTHQLCIEKDVKPGKKSVIYFVITSRPNLVPTIPARSDSNGRLLSGEVLLSEILLEIFTRLILLELHYI